MIITRKAFLPHSIHIPPGNAQPEHHVRGGTKHPYLLCGLLAVLPEATIKEKSQAPASDRLVLNFKMLVSTEQTLLKNVLLWFVVLVEWFSL